MIKLEATCSNCGKVWNDCECVVELKKINEKVVWLGKRVEEIGLVRDDCTSTIVRGFMDGRICAYKDVMGRLRHLCLGNCSGLSVDSSNIWDGQQHQS